jgi:hypothetical protein
LQYPNAGSTDQQINSYALPILVDQTVKQQGAHVQMVSGATYTSEGYLTSLQSALDQAGGAGPRVRRDRRRGVGRGGRGAAVGGLRLQPLASGVGRVAGGLLVDRDGERRLVA